MSNLIGTQLITRVKGFLLSNRPFPSSLVPLFKSESKCETMLIKMTHFHMKGFALRLVLKKRHKRTRKWPIAQTVDELVFPRTC